MYEKQELRVPVQNLHCYGCSRNFTCLEQFKSHHHNNNNERKKSHVKRKKHKFGPAQIKNEDGDSNFPIVNKCLKNQDEIKVTCDNCSIHFLSLQLFLTHLESPIQTPIEYESFPFFDNEPQNVVEINENLDLNSDLALHENINEDGDFFHDEQFAVFNKTIKSTKLQPESEPTEFFNGQDDNGDEIDGEDDSISNVTPSASASASPWQQIETDEEEEPGEIVNVNVCRRKYQRQYQQQNQKEEGEMDLDADLIVVVDDDNDDDGDFILEDSNEDSNEDEDCTDSSDSDFEIKYKPKYTPRSRKSTRGGTSKLKPKTRIIKINDESNSTVNPDGEKGEEDLDFFNEFDDGNSGEKKPKKNEKLPCDLCTNSKATYSNQRSLNKHKRRRHLPPTTAFVCPDCSYSFSTDDALGRHLARFTFETPTTCPANTCEEIFNMKCKLKIHLRETHPRRREREKWVKKDKVKKNKKSDSNKNIKVDAEKEDDGDGSSDSDFEINYKPKTKTRRVETTVNPDPGGKKEKQGEEDLEFFNEFDDENSGERKLKKNAKLKCDLCTNSKATYATQYSLNKHKRRRHLPPTTAFVCQDCSYSFPTDYELGRHIARFTFETPTTCPAQNCEEIFSMKCKLKMHLREIHPRQKEKEKRVKVEKVKKNKKSDSNKSGDPDKEDDGDGELPILKKQKCPLEGCNKMLVANKKAISRHLEIHNRDPNESHVCDTCGKQFHTKNYLKSHIKIVHERNLPFLCSLCGKKCSSKEKLVIHGRSHTGEKPFLCSACPLAFSTLSSLRRHSAIHSDQKQFKCPYIGCNKEFFMKGVLNRHLQIHSGVKPYKCLYCEMAFPDNRPLKKHVAIQHPQALQQQQMYESQQQ